MGCVSRGLQKEQAPARANSSYCVVPRARQPDALEQAVNEVTCQTVCKGADQDAAEPLVPSLSHITPPPLGTGHESAVLDQPSLMQSSHRGLPAVPERRFWRSISRPVGQSLWSWYTSRSPYGFSGVVVWYGATLAIGIRFLPIAEALWPKSQPEAELFRGAPLPPTAGRRLS